MDFGLENGFIVYRRALQVHTTRPDSVEEPLAFCNSYAEARQVLVELHRTNQDGVIRFQGETGGSD